MNIFDQAVIDRVEKLEREGRVKVSYLWAVFPELVLADTSPEEFAAKVKQAAELACREDAYVELRSNFLNNREETMEENEGE